MLDKNNIPPGTNVLIVDDERTTRLAISEALNQLGFHAQAVGSGEEAVDFLRQETVQVVILDLEMPGLKGTDVLVAAETIASDTAFIILTAHASTETAITALRSGAVDYLRKPSSLKVIATTVAKAARKQQEKSRQQQAIKLLQQAMSTFQPPKTPSSQSALKTDDHKNLIHVGQVAIDTHKQIAFYKEKDLDLTPIEYRLLHRLANSPNTICTYSQLGEASHDVEMDEVEARALLRTHMYRLGRKLGGKESSPLQSVWGRGFILNTTPMPPN